MKNTKKPLNTRQERFAQLVAQGIPAAQAYVEAGYTCRGNSAAVNGFYLLRTPRVEARVAEIQELAASLGIALLTIVEKRRFLAEVVRTPAGSVGPESWLCQAFYEKVKGGRNQDGETVLLRRRVKMPDKLRAIELDSKLAGHFPKAAAEAVEAVARPVKVNLEAIREAVARLGERSLFPFPFRGIPSDEGRSAE